jgi:hypothetical protein
MYVSSLFKNAAELILIRPGSLMNEKRRAYQSLMRGGMCVVLQQYQHFQKLIILADNFPCLEGQWQTDLYRRTIGDTSGSMGECHRCP